MGKLQFLPGMTEEVWSEREREEFSSDFQLKLLTKL
jgi:hypothetical protein